MGGAHDMKYYSGMFGWAIQLISHLPAVVCYIIPPSLTFLSITLGSDLTKSMVSQCSCISQWGMLALYLMNHILIRVSEKNKDDPSAKFKETQELDKNMVDIWLAEADSVVVFVCARSTILSISPSKEHIPRLLCSRLSSQSPLLKATSG